jgi:hypothetical protein
MRRFSMAALAAALLVLPASALALPFTGTLSIQYLADATTIPTLEIAGSGTSTDGPGGSFTLAAGAFAGNDSEISLISAPALVQLDLDSVSSGAGSFSGGTGTMAVNGDLVHYFFQAIPGQAIPIPLADVGVGGASPFAVVLSLTGPASGTITGSTWTTGVINVPGVNPLSASGFDSRALDGTGAIRFVTPIQVSLDLGTGPQPVAAYAQLDLLFTAAVPEPGALALVAAGLTLLLGVRGSRTA